MDVPSNPDDYLRNGASTSVDAKFACEILAHHVRSYDTYVKRTINLVACKVLTGRPSAQLEPSLQTRQ